jgi:hypothetical protein
MMRLLPEAGVNPNRSVGGIPPLWYGVYANSLEGVKLPVEYGADIHSEFHGGHTALSAAYEFGYSKIAAFLESVGARESFSRGAFRSLDIPMPSRQHPQPRVAPQVSKIVRPSPPPAVPKRVYVTVPTCANCYTKVLPTPDGLCPSCRVPFVPR